ncbi:MAG: flagellar type III secretion system pore protein FliP [Candidatus Hinthialibacter antarcticus]|nr:flagellar type III secretion system pore protein FliP [Candidatus Hinthialibacter antarcticus]
MVKRRWFYCGFIAYACLVGVMSSHAQQQPILPSLGLDGEGPSPDDVSTTLQLLFGLTVLSLLPSILVMTTSFIRISIVLGFVRRAIGTQQTPSNEIMIGLTLFLTLFIMTPVIDEIYTTAIQPYLNEEMEPLLPGEVDPFGEVVETKIPRFYVMIYKAIIPLRTFMWQQIGEKGASDVAVMMSIAGMNKPDDEHDVPTHVLIPAFMISEIKKAFMMGFMIFIPFLILDLVTASVLISMGMFQLPPAFISLPFKVLLFVLVDGWSILMRSLSISFVQNMQ